MTSLDPTHIPGFERTSDPTTGQAVKTSVSINVDDDEEPSSSQPSWRGAWKRRQEAKLPAQRQLGRRGTTSGSDEEEEDEEEEEEGKRQGNQQIPIPPIPDLRYEQGILSSIKPFLHSTIATTTTTTQDRNRGDKVKETKEHEEKLKTVEQSVLASSQLTAGQEKEQGSQSDALMGPMRIEWGMVSYVLFRDQVVFPLLQGVLWGMAGIYLNGLWEWNRGRLAAKNLAQGAGRNRGSGPSLLSRLGLSA